MWDRMKTAYPVNSCASVLVDILCTILHAVHLATTNFVLVCALT